MMLTWQAIAGRRLLVYLGAAAAGIAAARSLGGPALAWVGLALPCVAGALALRRLPLSLPCAALAVALLAGGRYLQATALHPALAPLLGHHALVQGLVADDPRPAAQGRQLAFPLQVSELGGRPTRRLRLLAIVPWRPDLRPGDQLELTGYLAPPRLATNPAELSRRGRDFPATLLVGDPSLLVRFGHQPPGRWSRLVAAVRARARLALGASMPGPYPEQMAGLLGSLVLGTDTFPLAPSLGETLRRAGIIHIAVVSGTQISLLFLAVYSLARRRRSGPGGMAPPPRPHWVLLAAGLAVGYVALAGGGEPTVRAAVMALLVAVGQVLAQVPPIADRHPLQPDHYASLAAAGCVLLLASPGSLFVPGAQLSFAAVWGLIYLRPRLAALLPRSRPWRFGVATSFAPQLAVAPLLCWHFASLPLAGFAANLVAVPLAGLLLAGGLAALLVGALHPAAAIPLNWLNRSLLEVLLALALPLARLPGGAPALLVRSLGVIALYYLALAAAAELLWRYRLAQEAARSLAADPFRVD